MALLSVRRLRGVLWAVVAFAALPAGSALADTTIGQVGLSGLGCPGQAALADTNYVVPSDGLVTSFSFQSVSQDANDQLDFLVLRPGGGSDYTVVGKTGLVTLAGTGGVETFSPSVPIAVRGGDVLGLWSPSVVVNCFRPAVGGGFTGGAVGGDQASDPAVSAPVGPLSSGPLLSEFDLNESANLAPPIPTLKVECENGGWRYLTDNKGRPFKNQGDCVSFVATGGKNPANG